jgi:hypothetical protein
MPGELLRAMAAPGVSKSKLSRAKADLYLIVSKLWHWQIFFEVQKLTITSPRKIQSTSKIFCEILELRSLG